MHPELQHAIKSGLLTTEVIKIFKKHHSGAIENFIDGYPWDYYKLVHSDDSFWDKWKPLSHRLGTDILWDRPAQYPEPFLNIYKGPTQEIISWLCDTNRKNNVCFVVEPQQRLLARDIPDRVSVITSICCNADRLGVGDTYHSSIEKITSQLAARYPPYRRILAKRLVDNPRILRLPTRVLFKKLINEPWKIVQQSYPRYITAPPVIVLRWLSYYDKELYDVICEFGLPRRSSSLLWIIAVDRAVLPLTGFFLEPIGQYVYTKHPVSYDDGPSDAALILRYMFRDVHPHLSNDRRLETEDLHRTGEKWPSDEQILQLARISSGILESIEDVINFVNREDGGTPEAHLERFLSYMIDSPSPSDERPHCAIDHFYICAFSDIPAQFLPVASEILGMMYYYYLSGVVETSALEFGRLLSAPKATILNACTYLSGWALTGSEKLDRIYPSFRDFLTDPKRFGKFNYCPEMGQTAFETFLHFLSCSSSLFKFLTVTGQSTQVVPETIHEIAKLRRVASRVLCAPIAAFRSAVLERVLTLRPDFRCLASTPDVINPWDFMEFLQDLCKWDKCSSRNIVRTEPADLLDQQFIDKCKGIAEPWDIDNKNELLSPKYVLFGVKNQTVLVLLENVGSGRGEERGYGVTIYTSEMLDLM